MKMRLRLILCVLALAALAMPATADKVDDLIWDLLYGATGETRANAAVSLGRVGDPRAVEPLCEALKDEYVVVRIKAVEALVKIGDPRAVYPLLKAIPEMNKEGKEMIFGAIASIGEPAVNPLIVALKDEDFGVRMDAGIALGMIGEPAVEPLIGVLRGEDSEGSEDGYQVQEPEFIRWTAAYTLGKIGDPRAVDSLIEALKDEDSGVRRTAARSLGEIGDVRAVDALTYIAQNDEDEYFRKAAAEALAAIENANK
jgi:HEAT repeat protein